jgi:hypothetical protein
MGELRSKLGGQENSGTGMRSIAGLMREKCQLFGESAGQINLHSYYGPFSEPLRDRGHQRGEVP